MSMLSFADKDKRVDTILISVAGLFLACSGFLILDDTFLFQNMMVAKQLSQQNPIATLASPVNDVRKKSPSDLVWIPVTNNTRVIEKDTIFTGANSTAIVKFDDGTEFTLEPESMVIIEKKANSANVEIARGGVSGKLGKTVRLKAQGNKDFELSSESGAEINLNLAGGKGPKVDVLSGDADFNTAKGKKKIAQNQTVEFGKGEIAKVKKHLIKLEAPGVNQEVIMSPKQRLSYEWKALASADEYQFELSQSRKFNGKYFKKKTRKNTFQTPRPKKQGEYFWRVKLYKQGTLISESLPRKVIIIHEKPPQLILPNKAEVLTFPYLAEYLNDYSKAIFEVNFKWLTFHDINKTQIVISKDKNFKKSIFDSAMDETFLKKDFKPGKYFWKVRLNDSDSLKRTWSPVSQFQINLNRSKFKPKLLSPENKKVFDMFDFSLVMDFAWEDNPSLKEYHLEISSSPEFKEKDIILKEITEDNIFTWETVDKTNFYWRIKAVDINGVVTPYSPIRQFKVKDPPPPKAPEIKDKTLEKEFSLIPSQRSWDFLSFLISSANAAEDIVTAVDLEWQEVKRAVKYRLEISTTKSFSRTIFKTEVDKIKFTWKHNQVGTYYWRVSAIDKKGIVSLPSSPGTIKLRFDKPAPIGEAIYQYPIEEKQLIQEFHKGKIEWTTGKFAAKYQVQIADNKDFNNSKRFFTPKNFAEVDLKLDKAYYWRVRSIDKRGRIASNYSDTKVIRMNPTINNFPIYLKKPEEISRFRYTEDAHPPIEFNWSKAPYTYHYEFEVSQDPTFESIVLNQKIEKNKVKFVAKAPLRDTFFWRVRATNPYSKGPWSEIRSFNIISNENLDIPDINYPSNSVFKGNNEIAEVYFEWDEVEEALSYIIEIGLDPKFKFGKKIYLASNENALIKLKTKATYYYRVRSSFIIPHNENVSEISGVPTKGIGEPTKLRKFVLNKGYRYESEIELGTTSFGIENKASTTTSHIVEGSGKNLGLDFNFTQKWYPRKMGGKWGFGLGLERASTRLQFDDTTNNSVSEFAYRQQATRAFLSYRTTWGRKTRFEFNIGAARWKKTYPYLNSGVFQSPWAEENFSEFAFMLRWQKRENIYHSFGVQSGVSANSSYYVRPWIEIRYTKNRTWFGFKVKYELQDLNYSFDETLPQSTTTSINALGFIFTTGVGF